MQVENLENKIKKLFCENQKEAKQARILDFFESSN